MGTQHTKVSEVLDEYKVQNAPLYILGSFSRGVTVLDQQIRALNLAWAMVETGSVPTAKGDESNGAASESVDIAIIGGGIAGLTMAAALLRKKVRARVTVFEQRDTLMPRQQGSDSRWLHPHIYEWPGRGSEASAAMLPVMNWTAGRASDVAVELLSAWSQEVQSVQESEEAETEQTNDRDLTSVQIYCNSGYVRISESEASGDRLSVEWIGEERRPEDGGLNSGFNASGGRKGRVADFDCVILAVGFGEERDAEISYWRNDTFGQPSLDHTRSTYIVSGQGDGAMVDLFRLCISQFRQDRILAELFVEVPCLLEQFQEIKQHAPENDNIFECFESVSNQSGEAVTEFSKVERRLSRRLRRDTDVVLHTKVQRLSDLFSDTVTRMSFQNRILLYLLYRCGGFVPSNTELRKLSRVHEVRSTQIVRRHGTKREDNVLAPLSQELKDQVRNGYKNQGSLGKEPPSARQWPGGYFGFRGKAEDVERETDQKRRRVWRKEYLPDPTRLVGTTLCAALGGLVRQWHPSDKRLRITLHRTLFFDDEEVLQQTCPYFGISAAAGDNGMPDNEFEVDSAGRTFPARNATIGLAVRCGRIVRSRPRTDSEKIASTMEYIGLNKASRRMSEDVSFVMAIPILESKRNFRGNTPVAGVVYLDSKAKAVGLEHESDFFVTDERLKHITSVIEGVVGSSVVQSSRPLQRMRNIPLARCNNEAGAEWPEELPEAAGVSLELVTTVEPPTVERAFELNVDMSEFVPVQE